MGLLSKVTDAVGLTDTGAGADAAKKAGRISAAAGKEARGFLEGQLPWITDPIQRYGDKAMGIFAPSGRIGEQSYGDFAQGSTVQGFGQNLADITGSGVLDPLIDERQGDMSNYLASVGLSRSGSGLEQMADIPLETILGLEGMLSGRQQQSAGMGLPMLTNYANTAMSMGQNMSNIRGTSAGNIAGLITGTGEAMSSSVLAGAQADAADRAQLGNVIGTGLGVAGGVAALSDARLKKNIKKVDQAGPLGIYEWDWVVPINQPTVGFMAQEVETIYPQHIHDISGFKGVDYDAVIRELEAA